MLLGFNHISIRFNSPVGRSCLCLLLFIKNVRSPYYVISTLLCKVTESCNEGFLPSRDGGGQAFQQWLCWKQARVLVCAVRSDCSPRRQWVLPGASEQEAGGKGGGPKAGHIYSGRSWRNSRLWKIRKRTEQREQE